MAKAGILPLVGREPELARLSCLLDDLHEGTGRMAVVQGEPGSGKTRLLTELSSIAGSARVTVAAAAADLPGATAVFGTIAEAFDLTPTSTDPARARIAERLQPQGDREGPWAVLGGSGFMAAAVDAVVDHVQRLCARRPVMLVLDDVQWLDEGSMRCLHVLARGECANLAVVLARRRTPCPPTLDELLAASDDELERVDVGPLTGAEVGQLVELRLGRPVGPALLREAARAAGNPFLVLGWIDTLEREGLLAETDDRIDLATAGPPAPGPHVLARVRSIDPETLHVVRLASVLGQRFSVAELAAFTDRAAVSLVEPIAEAIAAGVLDDSGELLAFRHELIREALEAQLPQSLRRALHHDAAKACRDTGAPVTRVAAHLLDATAGTDPATIAWVREVGRELAAENTTATVTLLERTVAACAPDNPVRAGIEADLALALNVVGQPVAAAQRAKAALDRSPDIEVVRELRWALAYSAFATGQFGEAVAQLDALRACSPDTPDTLVLVQAAYARLLSFDLASAQRTAMEAVEVADRADDAVASSIALTALSYIFTLEGTTSRAIEFGRRAVTAADRSPRREGHRFQPNLWLALAYSDSDLPHDFERAMHACLEIGTNLGTGWDAPIRHGVQATEHYRTGAWDDCLAECEAGLTLSSEHGLGLADILLLGLTALVHLHRDQMAESAKAIAAAQHALTSGGPRIGFDHLTWAQALALEAAGEASEAVDTLMRVVQAAGWFSMYGVVARSGPDLVRLAVGAARADAAAIGRDAAAEISRRSGGPVARASALRAEALVTNEAGPARAAVTALRDTNRRPDLAGALEDAGRIGRDPRLLEEAAALWDTLGARRDLQRVRQLADLPPAQSRGRATSGWASLTRSERKVVDLVGEGLSNPEVAARLYLSRRTVETHLYHVYEKLGVGSRVELALFAAAHRQD